MSDFTPISQSVVPGQKVVVENIGVKRIFGVDLVNKAKIANWLFYLEDINTAVVYANDGTEVWYSTLGQPAAGPLSVRESLVPFEGQRYYVIEEDKAYQFVGGSWVGTVFEGNLIQPSVLILDGPQQLAVGRRHLLNGNGEFVLPTTNVKDGHEIEFNLFDTRTAQITTEDESSMVLGEVEHDPAEEADGPLPLSRGVTYRGIFYNGQWSLFYSSADDYLSRSQNLNDVQDIIAARENLNIYSRNEVLVVAAGKVDEVDYRKGLVKVGTSLTGDMVIDVDFATLAEAEDTNITDKVLSPATIVPAVNTANRENQHNNITGLLPAAGETKFNITGVVGTGDISWPEFTCAFNPDPYVRSQPLQLITFLANSVTIPFVAGTFTHQVVARDDGTVVLQATRPLKSSVTEVLLGGVVTVDGNIIANNLGQPSIGVYPRLASSDYALRNNDAEVSNVIFSPVGGATGQVEHTTFRILEEGVNWENSTSLPHTKTIPATNPAEWLVMASDGTIEETDITLVDGENLDDGTTVPNNSYSIQLVYTSIEGDLIVLRGQQVYGTIEEARADVFAYQPTVPSILANSIEVARWVVRGNQHPTSGAYDLTDSANFLTFAGIDVNNAAVPNNATDITSGNTSNNLQSTNLQEQIDELSHRGEIVTLTTQNIERSRVYRIAFSGTKSLPSANPAGQVIGFYARSTDLQGVLEVADTGTESIFFASAPAVIDTQLAIDTPATFYWLRSNGTQWEITNA